MLRLITFPMLLKKKSSILVILYSLILTKQRGPFSFCKPRYLARIKLLCNHSLILAEEQVLPCSKFVLFNRSFSQIKKSARKMLFFYCQAQLQLQLYHQLQLEMRLALLPKSPTTHPPTIKFTCYSNLRLIMATIYHCKCKGKMPRTR